MTNTITLNTHIHSPRQIANGLGAWDGTVAEMLEWHWSDAENAILNDVNIVVDGYDEEDEDYIWEPADEELVSYLTYEHICFILDDPNITLTN